MLAGIEGKRHDIRVWCASQGVLGKPVATSLLASLSLGKRNDIQSRWDWRRFTAVIWVGSVGALALII